MGKMVIVEGKQFEAIFVIKQPGSETPLDLTGSTGTFTMSTTGENPCKVIDNKAMTLYDAINGKFKITLSSEETTGLDSDVAFEEDGFPLAATYKAYLDITSPDYGQIFVRIPQIYVEDGGSICPVT